MQVNKVGNIIYYDFKTSSKKEDKTSQDDKRQSTFDSEKTNFPAVPISVIQHLSEAYDSKTEEIELAEQLKMNGLEVPFECIKPAIEEYYRDAREMHPVLKGSFDFMNQFEKDIKNIDFSQVNKLRNFYGDGNASLRAQTKNNIMGFDFEDMICTAPSEESYAAMVPIVDGYIQILKKECPQYKIETLGRTLSNSDEWVYQTIRISKDGKTLEFLPQDFISSMALKSVNGDAYVMTATPEDADYNYSYSVEEEILQKSDKKTGIVIGAVGTESYDENGEAIFSLDDEDVLGPVFYAIKQYSMLEQSKMTTGLLQEETASQLIRDFVERITDDEDLGKFVKKGYDVDFFLSGVRNGAINLNVLEAMDYIYGDVEDSLYNIMPRGHVENVIDLIEEEGNIFNPDLLKVARNLLLKERQFMENRPEIVYEILTFLKINYTEENMDSINKMAQSCYIGFDECDELFRIVEMFNDDDSKSAKAALDSHISSHTKRWGGLENAQRFYSTFFKKYLK